MSKRHDYNYCSNYSKKDDTQYQALYNYKRKLCEQKFYSKGTKKLIRYLENKGYKLQAFTVLSTKTKEIYTLEDFING